MYTTPIWQVSLGGQAGVVTGRKMLENIDEFVQERLALYTHEEVFAKSLSLRRPVPLL